jgi:hypothetical protein
MTFKAFQSFLKLGGGNDWTRTMVIVDEFDSILFDS